MERSDRKNLLIADKVSGHHLKLIRELNVNVHFDATLSKEKLLAEVSSFQPYILGIFKFYFLFFIICFI